MEPYNVINVRGGNIIHVWEVSESNSSEDWLPYIVYDNTLQRVLSSYNDIREAQLDKKYLEEFDRLVGVERIIIIAKRIAGNRYAPLNI